MKYKKKGISLIEIVISIGILGIILVSFLTMFSFGFNQIVRSGNKNKDSFVAQKDLEKRLATGESSNPKDLEIKFGDMIVKSSGGEIVSQEGLLSKFFGFLPNVPTINLSEISLIEGYTGTHIKAQTKGLNLDSSKTKFTLYHYDGITPVTLVSSDISFTIDNDNNQMAILEIPGGLINSIGPYIIKGVTSETNKADKIARATLIVYPPNFIAAGYESIYAADTLDKWMDRKVSNFPEFSKINDIISYGNGSYIAVGDGGTVLKSENQKDWKKIVIGTENLNSIIRIDNLNTFIVVGDNGTIFTSTDGNSWTKTTSVTYNDIFDISYNGTNIVATGENGIILNSTDGILWSNTGSIVSTNINGITWDGSKFIAFGDNYTIKSETGTEFIYLNLFTSNDGNIWTNSNIATNSQLNLNAVATNGSGNTIAVGDSGVILSISGSSVNTVQNNITSVDLNNVIFNGTYGFLIVGDGGKLLKYKDGALEDLSDKINTSADLYSIATRISN